MLFGLRHHQLCGVIDGVSRAIPVDDHAVDTAADHVRNLAMDLIGVGGTIANIHVVQSSEPQQQMRINLRLRAGIKQRVDVHLADISRAGVAICLAAEIIGGARIVSGLRGQGSGRHYKILGRPKAGNGHEQNYSAQIFHRPQERSRAAERPVNQLVLRKRRARL